MLRKILIGIGLLIVALIGGAVYLVHRVESQIARDSQEKLQRLQIGVRVENGLLRQTSFYRAEDLGNVTQILVAWPADHESATLTAVGNLGVHFVDGNGVSRKEIRFSKGIGCPVEV